MSSLGAWRVKPMQWLQKLKHLRKKWKSGKRLWLKKLRFGKRKKKRVPKIRKTQRRKESQKREICKKTKRLMMEKMRRSKNLKSREKISFRITLTICPKNKPNQRWALSMTSRFEVLSLNKEIRVDKIPERMLTMKRSWSQKLPTISISTILTIHLPQRQKPH